METAFDCDILQGHVCLHQLPRQGDPAGQDVVVDAPAGDTGEFVAEIADTDAETPGQIITLDGMIEVVVNISGNFPDQGL